MVVCPACESDDVPIDGRCLDCDEPIDEAAYPTLESALKSLDEADVARVLTSIWQECGRDVSPTRENGTIYLTARREAGDSRELLRVSKDNPARSDLSDFAMVVDDHSFDHGYFVTTAALPTDAVATDGALTVIDRGALTSTIAAVGLRQRVLDAIGAEPAETKREPVHEDEAAFEAYPSFQFKIGRKLLGPLVVFLLVWVVSWVVLAGLANAILGGLPTMVNIPVVIASLVISSKATIRVVHDNGDEPVLRIDADGITHLDDDRSIDWADIESVSKDHMEVRNPSARFYTHEFPYLIIELSEDVETGALESIGSQLVTGDATNAHVVRMKDFDAEFGDIADAVERFSEVPVHS